MYIYLCKNEKTDIKKNIHEAMYVVQEKTKFWVPHLNDTSEKLNDAYTMVL